MSHNSLIRNKTLLKIISMRSYGSRYKYHLVLCNKYTSTQLINIYSTEALISDCF